MIRDLRKVLIKISCLILTAVLLAGSMPSVSLASKNTAQQSQDKENQKENLEDQMEKNEEKLEGLKGEQKELKAEPSLSVKILCFVIFIRTSPLSAPIKSHKQIHRHSTYNHSYEIYEHVAEFSRSACS